MFIRQLIQPKFKPWQAILAMGCGFLFVARTMASTYILPTDGSTVIGEIKVVMPSKGNTLLDIGRHFDLGHDEIATANPNTDVWVPEQGKGVVVPTQFILPPKPWTGVVINISQRRMFYFPTPAKDEAAKVLTLPVGIAREGWSTPLGNTHIKSKRKDPYWFPPPSIRAEHRANGDGELPEYFPPGPNNPMGMLAVELGFPMIYIHGTNKPWSVGLRASHGCLHLYPEDAAKFFDVIKPGVPVRVIDEPVVVGIKDRQLFMSTYEPVAEYGTALDLMTHAAVQLAPYLAKSVRQAAEPAGAVDVPDYYIVDWARVGDMAARPQAVPLSLAPAGRTLEGLLAAIEPQPYTAEPFGMDANNAMMPERYRVN